MAISRRRQAIEEAEESVFISVTDMMVAFLFIIIIMLAFFATQLRDEDEMVPASVHEQMLAERDEKLRLADAEILQMREEIDALRSVNTVIPRLQREQAALRQDLAQARSARAIIEQDRDAAWQRILFLEKETLRLYLNNVAQQRELAAARQRIEDLEQDALARYLAEVARQREVLLMTLKTRLEAELQENIEIRVDLESGILRLDSEALSFRSSRWQVDGFRQQRLIEVLADALYETLPCYTISGGRQSGKSCPEVPTRIETIQVEGHTDADILVGDPTGFGLQDNLDLSARRAASTYRMMLARQPLLEFVNEDDNPVLSIAGYGANRQIGPNITVADKARNRRIDLRFIMTTPRTSEAVEVIKESVREQTFGAPQRGGRDIP